MSPWCSSWASSFSRGSSQQTLSRHWRSGPLCCHESSCSPSWVLRTSIAISSEITVSWQSPWPDLPPPCDPSCGRLRQGQPSSVLKNCSLLRLFSLIQTLLVSSRRRLMPQTSASKPSCHHRHPADQKLYPCTFFSLRCCRSGMRQDRSALLHSSLHMERDANCHWVPEPVHRPLQKVWLYVKDLPLPGCIRETRSPLRGAFRGGLNG